MNVGDFNFEKLKSLGEEIFSSYGGQVHMVKRDSDNGNQRGA